MASLYDEFLERLHKLQDQHRSCGHNHLFEMHLLTGGAQTLATTAGGKISVQSAAECAFGGKINVGGLVQWMRQLTLTAEKTAANGFGT